MNPLSIFAPREVATFENQGGFTPNALLSQINPWAFYQAYSQNPHYAAALNATLKPFGQQLNMLPSTHPIFHQLGTQQGFIGHHPGIFQPLENAMLGAAGTPSAVNKMGEPIAQGFGGGLARAISGGESVRPQREMYAGRDILAPFAMASQVGALQLGHALQGGMSDEGHAALERTEADAARAQSERPFSDALGRTWLWQNGVGGQPGGYHLAPGTHAAVAHVQMTNQGELVTYRDGTTTLNGNPINPQTGAPIVLPTDPAQLAMMANTPGPYQPYAQKALQQLNANALAQRSAPHVSNVNVTNTGTESPQLRSALNLAGHQVTAFLQSPQAIGMTPAQREAHIDRIYQRSGVYSAAHLMGGPQPKTPKSVTPKVPKKATTGKAAKTGGFNFGAFPISNPVQ
jgi:hypothetical protein